MLGLVKVSAKIAAKVKEEFGVDVADAVTAEKIEVKKTAAKASRKAKETVKAVETKVEKKASKAKAVKLEIIVQSPMGGNITAEEIRHTSNCAFPRRPSIFHSSRR